MIAISNKRVNFLILCLIMLLSVSGCSLSEVARAEIDESNTVAEDSWNVASAKVDLESNSIDESLNLTPIDNISNQLQEASKNKVENGITYFKFIDVGAGDSCFIITPNNDVVLIDTGESNDGTEILDVMSAYSFENIDYLFLTHPYKDHIGGVSSIISKYNVKEIITSYSINDSSLFAELFGIIELNGITLTVPKLGDVYNLDGLSIQVVGLDSLDDVNNSSLVLRVSYGSTDILFMGDLELTGETILLNNGYTLESEILKIDDYGINSSTSDALLDTVNAKICIMSGSSEDSYNEPSEDVIDRLLLRNMQYFNTNDVGTITIESNGENVVYTLDSKIEVKSRSSLLESGSSDNSSVYVEVRMNPDEVLKDEINKN